jgi:hypothetical protein
MGKELLYVKEFLYHSKIKLFLSTNNNTGKDFLYIKEFLYAIARLTD